MTDFDESAGCASSAAQSPEQLALMKRQYASARKN
jgi:hypothetical protein